MVAKRKANVLGEDVRDVVSSRHVNQVDFGVANKFANPVKTNTNVFGSGLDHDVTSQSDGALVVTVNDGGLLGETQLGKQLAQPDDLSNAVGESDVLGLTRRLGDDRLDARPPRDGAAAKESNEPTARTTGVLTRVV